MGLNSGLSDAQNLIWKLGLALKSGNPSKYDTLLNTYETERKPIATRVAENSLSNMRNHGGLIDKAIGITSETSTSQNIAAMDAYFDPRHAEYKVKRERITEASKATDYEFHAPGIEIGWFYPSVDFEDQGIEDRHGGQLKEDGSFDFTNYHPSTIPGHHLPHAWLQRGTDMTSTRDLVKDDRFVLITEDATNWKRFANEMVDIEVIGENGWLPKDGAWRELCGIESNGVILVRPDGVVAWRAKNWKEEFGTSFPAIFSKVLGNPQPA